MTDSTGDTAERIKYDPYGEATVTVQPGHPSTGNPYLFQGRRWDSEADFYYFRNRVYSPELGRFLQRDPIGYIGGPNLYCAYFVVHGGLDAFGYYKKCTYTGRSAVARQQKAGGMKKRLICKCVAECIRCEDVLEYFVLGPPGTPVTYGFSYSVPSGPKTVELFQEFSSGWLLTYQGYIEDLVYAYSSTAVIVLYDAIVAQEEFMEQQEEVAEALASITDGGDVDEEAIEEALEMAGQFEAALAEGLADWIRRQKAMEIVQEGIKAGRIMTESQFELSRKEFSEEFAARCREACSKKKGQTR